MNSELTVSVSPHIHSPRTTASIMLDVVIALCPAAIAGIVIFGLRALLVIAVCVASAVAAEYIFERICKKALTVRDFSAVVTGLLLALNLPADVPLWQGAVGSVFAIIIVKCLFGGIGQNFANPAITARIFMIISFGSMAKASLPKIVDTASSATPLAVLSGAADSALPSLKYMLLGLHGGAIGETCTLALVIGGIYLLCRRVITFHTPVAFIGGLFLFELLLSGSFETASYQVMSGGLLIGAIFMATDYSSTPTTKWGMVVFGIGCAIITVAIREWGNYPDGVSFSILFMNILTPYIDKLTSAKPLGTVTAKEGQKQ